MICSLFIFLLGIIPGTLISQNTVRELDRRYGPDQALYNGKIYSYTPLPGTKGSQYLISPDFVDGSISIRGKCYRDIALNYDIFNQQLLLKFRDERGVVNTIEVSKAWLSGFSLGSMNFEYLRLENDPQFYQVLGEGEVRVVYHWRKNTDLESTVGTSVYYFTSPIKESFVLMDGQLKQFKSKRGLLKLFQPGERAGIKSYLRTNKIRVKKASDKAMADLITHIGLTR